MICGSRGSKSRLAKAAGAKPAVQMRDEKSHTIVIWSIFLSQNVQNTSASEHFWKLRCSKSVHCCGVKHISKSKCARYKTHHMLAPLLDVEASFCVVGARDCAPCQKVSKMWRFVACPKTMARMGHVKRICKDAFSVACAIQETCSSELLGGPGRWFPERGCILEHQIYRFAEMILRDRCSTSYDLASLFRGRRSTLDRWSGKIAKRIGRRPSALHSTFHFWRSLTELFRFWCCQLRKSRKSRRIVSFLMLSSSKIEEVSQTCFVLDAVKFTN